jgi:hypothetical protein
MPKPAKEQQYFGKRSEVPAQHQWKLEKMYKSIAEWTWCPPELGWKIRLRAILSGSFRDQNDHYEHGRARGG